MLIKFKYRGLLVGWLTGGLGNQLFIYAACLSYARQNNLKLKFDTRNFKLDPGRDLAIHKFKLSIKKINTLESMLFRPKLIQFLSIFLDSELSPTIIKENQSELCLDFFRRLKFVYLMGYWQRTEYFNGMRDELIQLIDLKCEYKTHDYKLFEEKINKSKSVSVHVRRGDYLDPKNLAFFEVLDIEYYQRAISVFSSYEFFQDMRIFIFTDDVKWVRSNFTFLDHYYCVSEKINSPELEFNLMKQCKYNIISNSTFSWWAAYLNDYSHKKVIMPLLFYKIKEYQALYSNNKMLQLDNSIKI